MVLPFNDCSAFYSTYKLTSSCFLVLVNLFVIKNIRDGGRHWKKGATLLANYMFTCLPVKRYNLLTFLVIQEEIFNSNKKEKKNKGYLVYFLEFVFFLKS